jgi:hypothetical protein
MAPPDAQEIMFAGAGILWGAVNFARGVSLWRLNHARSKSHKKSTLPPMIVGFALVIGCTAYLALSMRVSTK